VIVCSADGRPVETNAGFSVTPQYGPEAIESADTTIVAPVDPTRLTRDLPGGLADVLDKRRSGSRIASICTGGFFLAAAGLLDGRPVTTHWECAPLFRRWYPHIRLDEGVLFVDDGDVLTSAGAAAGVDLCLHLIRTDHGTDLANRAARRCVVPPFRDGGQAQYIERPIPDDGAASTSATRQWALQQLGEPLDLSRLAQHAHMSLRTFGRRFRDETGLTPRRWLIHRRLDRARHLLESSTMTVDQIASEIGFAPARMSGRTSIAPTAETSITDRNAPSACRTSSTARSGANAQPTEASLNSAIRPMNTGREQQRRQRHGVGVEHPGHVPQRPAQARAEAETRLHRVHGRALDGVQRPRNRSAGTESIGVRLFH
jgi:transcriptional regulator GlxA family with amidase domain